MRIRPTPLAVLKKYWGFDAFRPLQEEIIQAAMKGDTLALLPTGGGKSICFQVPGMVLDGITIVISPLVALMQDQVENLKQKGIPAYYLSGHQSFHEQDVILDNCIFGGTKFLYISPERLQQPLFQERLKQMNVGLLAIDEAHCISQWGHQFRPEYRQIAKIRELIPNTPCLAVTATATEKVVDDISIQLNLLRPTLFKQSFVRENLSYNVRKGANKFALLVEVLQPFKTFSTIVFVNTRAHAEEVARFLNHNHFSAGFYHAGLKAKDREKIQEDWIQNNFRTMVATNAFGMGIDKPDVRLVVHYDLPASPEAYFQEAGRAGRDGERAYSVVLFDELDEKIQSDKLQQSFLELESIESVYNKLCNHFQIALGDQPEQHFSLSLRNFCHSFQLQPVKTVVALKALHQMGVLVYDSETIRPDRIKAIAEPTHLYAFQLENSQWGWLAQALVRMDGNLFHGYSRIDLDKISNFTQQPKEKILQGLLTLHQLQLFDFQAGTDEPWIEFLTPRKTKLDVQPYLELKKWEETIWRQWTTFLGFCKEEDHCRTALLLQYFGENAPACGHCDVCRKKKQTESLSTGELKEAIWKDFTKQRIWGKSELLEKWNCSKNVLHAILEELLLEELIVELEEDAYERR